jgi:hypothetical protein
MIYIGERNLAILIITMNVFLLGSCSSIHAGIYLISIDNDSGETILRNEPGVRVFLENIIESYKNYSIRVFARTGVNFQMKRSRLLTHSYYLINNVNGEYHTLSFYGTKMKFRSEGAWALDADSDKTSYKMYLEDNNKWDVEELYRGDVIDVRRTLTNIINRMDSGITYYYKDHITDRPNVDNCNTALYETVVLEGGV